MINVLALCENSGVIRDAFIRAGCYAISVDLLPSLSDFGPHHTGDALEFLYDVENNPDWNLIIAHPDCTYLTSSAAWAFGDGPYHQKVKPGTLVGADRRAARENALDFVQKLMDAPFPRICIENPVGAIGTRIRKADQYIQPHEYGHDASKKTGLWLKGLPPLRPTKNIEGRMVEWPKASGKYVERWGNQTDSGQNKLTPSEDRWKTRSKTYQGWADAMVEQWLPYIKQGLVL